MHGTLHLISISPVAFLLNKHHELLLFSCLVDLLWALKFWDYIHHGSNHFPKTISKTSFLSNHVPPIIAFDIIFNQSIMNDGDCVFSNLTQVVVDLGISKGKKCMKLDRQY